MKLDIKPCRGSHELNQLNTPLLATNFYTPSRVKVSEVYLACFIVSPSITQRGKEPVTSAENYRLDCDSNCIPPWRRVSLWERYC
ncbi:hypothetical protein E2C01_094547 [Portunus trituberculatus]|uniref:Uncharacterized protein n=1 Tax=Portunus trituberculatus TaxID=210409 RepID=A0A5B7JME9_PORTR|nr:hypothetical protein [Portunus trituberculatus]